MDSTTAPQSFVSFLRERQQLPHAHCLTLLAQLADAGRRHEVAHQLAQCAGAEELLIFIPDPQLKILLPAPGFPHTLPQARRWQSFLEACTQQTVATASLWYPNTATCIEATGFATADGSVLVLLGGRPDWNVAANLCLVLPLFTAAVRGEGMAQAAEAQTRAAQEVAQHAELLAVSLDKARQALQRALAGAEAANAAKDQFLAMLSHELRTPLTPVLASASAMEADTHLPPAVREEMALMRHNIELEARLIDDLLDLTRISRGKLQLEMTSIDVHDIVRQAIRIITPEASAKQVQLQITLQARHSALEADPARLHQVFWNLLKNAVKFTPSGGSISVHTSDDPTGHILVEIRDTGMGIAPQVLPRIFNAFEQAGQSITRQFGGLGLGLAIGKAIVHLHGGTITAVSPGRDQGATFTVALPMPSVPPARAVAPPALNQTLPRSWRILFVEDHDSTARVLTRLLEQHGHLVHRAASCSAALEMADVHPFNLVISDLGLPDGSGLELMRQIRQRHPVRGIALSGYGMEEDVQASLQAGFDVHLIKPIRFAQLQAAIQKLNCGEP